LIVTYVSPKQSKVKYADTIHVISKFFGRKVASGQSPEQADSRGGLFAARIVSASDSPFALESVHPIFRVVDKSVVQANARFHCNEVLKYVTAARFLKVNKD
jgi:hypothetical protein